MSCSRILCQMMRVISSPSISTTGFFTLIFATRGSSENPNDTSAGFPVRQTVVPGTGGEALHRHGAGRIDDREIPVLALMMFRTRRNREQAAVRRPVRIVVPP